MDHQAFNPFLPPTEYLPDPEPRVFGDRVYVYGSHDRFNGLVFCLGDYVCYSAPVDDLGDWRFEGTIYRKNQDPHNPLGLRLLFAPDVVQGPDGRFYLYYALDFLGLMGVAVADGPVGPYGFLGYVRFPDGLPWGRHAGDPFPFDPGVLVDEGRVFLYSGFGRPVPRWLTAGRRLSCDGGVVLELEPDMVTVAAGPTLLFPREGEGAFAGHEFFEASSIRKVGASYCFVYSSRHNHELCHAVSDRPDGGFRFAGTLVSQGDLFLDGRTAEVDGVNYLGNTHGGLACLGGRWYVFYHRQTNRHSFSRQACAEPLEPRPDGGFYQARVSSCGLNRGPLAGVGRYPARIACVLRSQDGVGRYDGPRPRSALRDHPYFTQDRPDDHPRAVAFVANLRDGAVCGFRTFALTGLRSVSVVVRGRATGVFEVAFDPGFTVVAAELPLNLGSRTRWTEVRAPCVGDGLADVSFRFRGRGAVDFLEFGLASS